MTAQEKDTLQISRLQVLHSAAGYYIGRTYFDMDMGIGLPYSRESLEYFPSREEAQSALNSRDYTPKINP